MFWEILLVILHSKRIQWSILLGFICFIAIYIWGSYQAGKFEMSEQNSLLTNFLRNHLLSSYKEKAFGTLFVSWGLAYKFYKKDKKRFYNSFK